MINPKAICANVLCSLAGCPPTLRLSSAIGECLFHRAMLYADYWDDPRTTAAVMQNFSRDHCVITPDCGGHGLTIRSNTEPRWRAIAPSPARMKCASSRRSRECRLGRGGRKTGRATRRSARGLRAVGFRGDGGCRDTAEVRGRACRGLWRADGCPLRREPAARAQWQGGSAAIARTAFDSECGTLKL